MFRLETIEKDQIYSKWRNTKKVVMEFNTIFASVVLLKEPKNRKPLIDNRRMCMSELTSTKMSLLWFKEIVQKTRNPSLRRDRECSRKNLGIDFVCGRYYFYALLMIYEIVFHIFGSRLMFLHNLKMYNCNLSTSIRHGTRLMG
uniref:Uncharacterized protein n=1 Tax=Lactuca sativa TaxID=4236 RepID=A0A9R1XA92_LACSA|nr:hypothetical protein LSAT_V11C600337020 [Lactuca sativa]